MKKIIVLIAVVVLFAACRFDFDEKRRDSTAGFVPVESIYGVPTGSIPHVVTGLSGTAMPENATNKKIEWSIKTDGGTNSTLEGARLSANAEGTVTVTAVIKNGLGEGKDYTQDFEIEISLTGVFAVKEIHGIPVEVPIGDYELNGRVSPSNTSYKTIIWSVIDQGKTGAAISGNTLTTTAGGKVKIRATVANGLLDRDFTQDFTITITRDDIYLAGYDVVANSNININLTSSKAYWWVGGNFTYLDVPAGTTLSYTSGIVFAGGKPYIAGWYRSGANNVSCYWVIDGGTATRTDLDQGTGSSTVQWNMESSTRIHSIAADGTDVYIHGRVGGANYLWKIAGGTGTGTRIQLAVPQGETVVDYSNNNYSYFNLYTVRLAVNGGKVYIPFITGSIYNSKGYYWDETGAYNRVDTTFTIAGTAYSVYRITSVAVLNGRVYMAGFVKDAAGKDDYKMGYWVQGESGFTVFSEDKNIFAYIDELGAKYTVNSIVEQNGSPVFYGSTYYDDYYWDASGKRTTLVFTSFIYDTGNVVVSDGDVYMLQKFRGAATANASIWDFGCAYIVVGGQSRVIRERTYDYVTGYYGAINVTGIAIP